MEWIDESCVLTDIQLQLLLQGLGCTELYGLPLKRWKQDQSALIYQIHSLVKKQLLSVSGDVLSIAEPLREWLSAAAGSGNIYKFWIAGQPPRTFCAYFHNSQVVVMERYPYQEGSIRIQGYRRSDFYEEILQILEDVGFREDIPQLPEEIFLEGQTELEKYYETTQQTRCGSVSEKFYVDICSREGKYVKSIRAAICQWKEYLILKTEEQVQVFPFQAEKLKELMEGTVISTEIQ